MSGKLIVFEGISGTGKETQAKLLRDFLARKHIRARIVFHPTTAIKPILRAQKTVKDQLAVLAHDREGRVKKFIRPAILRGEWVISLRNYISAYVYQGNGSIVQNVDMQPDCVLYFDLSPAAAMKRILQRGERRGKYETLKRLEEKRDKYKQILKTIPHHEVDASQTIQQIHMTICRYVHVLIR